MIQTFCLALRLQAVLWGEGMGITHLGKVIQQLHKRAAAPVGIKEGDGVQDGGIVYGFILNMVIQRFGSWGRILGVKGCTEKRHDKTS